jgi:hypothetical protein
MYIKHTSDSVQHNISTIMNQPTSQTYSEPCGFRMQSKKSVLDILNLQQPLTKEAK